MSDSCTVIEAADRVAVHTTTPVVVTGSDKGADYAQVPGIYLDADYPHCFADRVVLLACGALRRAKQFENLFRSGGWNQRLLLWEGLGHKWSGSSMWIDDSDHATPSVIKKEIKKRVEAFNGRIVDGPDKASVVVSMRVNSRLTDSDLMKMQPGSVLVLPLLQGLKNVDWDAVLRRLQDQHLLAVAMAKDAAVYSDAATAVQQAESTFCVECPPPLSVLENLTFKCPQA